ALRKSTKRTIPAPDLGYDQPPCTGRGIKRRKWAVIKGRHLFTSESVTEGHPDKVADQISDAILDHVMTHDPMGRVACETLVTTGLALVAGEITTKSVIDYASIVRRTVQEIGIPTQHTALITRRVP